MNLSLREGLSKIGEPKPGQANPAIPGGFHSAPTSLGAMIKAMNSPQPSQWKEVESETFKDKSWTQRCQGVTTDGEHWYISSNSKRLSANPLKPIKTDRRIYKFTRNMKLIDSYSVEHIESKHLGDVDYSDGIIYAAMEHPPGILKVDSEFKFSSFRPLQGETTGSESPQAGSLPWCAINPWNGYLYSSRFHQASEIYAYDPKDNFLLKVKDTLKLEVATDDVQGGCFSKNGHLLLASNASHDIRCYSVLNGKFLGSAPIRFDDSKSAVGEEVEGLAIWEGVAFDAGAAHVHLILLDKDVFKDDVHFKHYTMPNPEDL
jgi:hypothetical protein